MHFYLKKLQIKSLVANQIDQNYIQIENPLFLCLNWIIPGYKYGYSPFRSITS